MRGQAGAEHGGPPWFKEESSPAGWRELLTPWVDERVRSLSHRGAVTFKWSSGSHQCPKNNWCHSGAFLSPPAPSLWITGHYPLALRPTPHPAGTRVIGRTTRSDPASGFHPGRFKRRRSLRPPDLRTAWVDGRWTYVLPEVGFGRSFSERTRVRGGKWKWYLP